VKPIPGLIVELEDRHDGHPSPGERGKCRAVGALLHEGRLKALRTDE
jgi:hypothetical protein